MPGHCATCMLDMVPRLGSAAPLCALDERSFEVSRSTPNHLGSFDLQLQLVIHHSLSSSGFRQVTGYSGPKLIAMME